MSTAAQPTAPRATTPAQAAGPGVGLARRILNLVIAILLGLVLLALALLATALVLVPLFWGPTPFLVALFLAAGLVVALAALLLGATRLRSVRMVLGAALSCVVLALLSVVASQFFAYTPAIAAPGSIATLEQVRLGDSQQWISIRGDNAANPVLLWLSGGPGGSQLGTVRHHLGGLEAQFVVVNWEQPGAGKSYHAVPHAQLTRERYIADAHELALYLRQRFGVEKIYLVGESWGSALGVWLAQRYPDLFYAFVGTGQMVDFVETEVYDYNFDLDLARRNGDTAKVAQLEQQGPPPYSGSGVVQKQANYLLDGFGYMNDDPAISDDGWNTFDDLLSPEYGLYDKLNWVRGVLDSGDVMFPQLWQEDVDFRQQAPRLAVPVYFLIGRHDINAPPYLSEEYYSLLDAPYKDLVWFEHSGHNPWVTEADRFVEVLVNRVLPETGPKTRR